jgi:hypothetical protein
MIVVGPALAAEFLSTTTITKLWRRRSFGEMRARSNTSASAEDTCSFKPASSQAPRCIELVQSYTKSATANMEQK